MTKIVYRRLPDLVGAIRVQNERGLDTLFSDHLAYMAFVRGLSELRREGVDITLTDQNGFMVVGDVMDPANKLPVIDPATGQPLTLADRIRTEKVVPVASFPLDKPHNEAFVEFWNRNTNLTYGEARDEWVKRA